MCDRPVASLAKLNVLSSSQLVRIDFDSSDAIDSTKVQSVGDEDGSGTKSTLWIRLFIVIAVSSTVPAFIILFCETLQAIAERFSFLDSHQPLDDLLDSSYLIRDSRTGSKSSMDGKLGGVTGSYIKYWCWEAVE